MFLGLLENIFCIDFSRKTNERILLQRVHHCILDFSWGFNTVFKKSNFCPKTHENSKIWHFLPLKIVNFGPKFRLTNFLDFFFQLEYLDKNRLLKHCVRVSNAKKCTLAQKIYGLWQSHKYVFDMKERIFCSTATISFCNSHEKPMITNDQFPSTYGVPHSVWKSPKMSHLNFWIMALLTIFRQIKIDISGNTVWL